MIIGICELYNPNIHGGENTYMKYKFMVECGFDLDEFYNYEHISHSQFLMNEYNASSRFVTNNDYSDFEKIVTNPKYFNAHILQEEELDTGEMICVIKTYYISLLQRKWKKIYKEKQRIINMRKSPNFLMHRQLTGLWPKNNAKYV